MKTPYAILIGLALIAAALFFRQPSISPAQAGIMGGDAEAFRCNIDVLAGTCYVLHGTEVTALIFGWKDGWRKPIPTKWR